MAAPDELIARRPVRQPELAELRALVTVLEEGSISGAARLLGVTQPALAKRIRSLETILGLPLLERSTAGARPTPAGARLAAGALRVLREADALSGLVAELHGHPDPLRLGASPAVAESVLPQVLAGADGLGWGVPIELVVANSSAVRGMLAAGCADIGIVAAGPGEDADAPLFAVDELVVGVPAGHPWSAFETVPVHEITRTPLVVRDPRSNQRETLDGLLAARGVGLTEPIAEVGSTAALIATARERRVPALLSRLSAGADCGLELRSVAGYRLARRFVVLARADRLRSDARRRLHAALCAAGDRSAPPTLLRDGAT